MSRYVESKKMAGTIRNIWLMGGEKFYLVMFMAGKVGVDYKERCIDFPVSRSFLESLPAYQQLLDNRYRINKSYDQSGLCDMAAVVEFVDIPRGTRGPYICKNPLGGDDLIFYKPNTYLLNITDLHPHDKIHWEYDHQAFEWGTWIAQFQYRSITAAVESLLEEVTESSLRKSLHQECFWNLAHAWIPKDKVTDGWGPAHEIGFRTKFFKLAYGHAADANNPDDMALWEALPVPQLK